jgi:predicted transposase/invertase (TIGR01784 family)
MKRDPLFFRLFKELPNCFFQLVGRSDRDAARYQLEAIEYKTTAVRLDGVFRPIESAVGPAYIWEAQFYRSDTVYANLLSKIGRFLEHGDPSQDWVGVVIYPTRELEQKNLKPYRCLLNSEQLVRIYLDELPPAPTDRFEMGILELITSKPEAAMKKAQAMVPSLRASKHPEKLQRMLLQLIETVIVHQFPKWSREEIGKMLQVTDVRQTRVFQEGVEEGIEQGIETVAMRMIEAGRPVPEIVKMTGLTTAQVRSLVKKSKK